MPWREEIRARLEAPLPGVEAQLRFAPTPRLHSWDPSQTPIDARRAAALILVYPGESGPMVLLTVRHAGLPHHGGQVSLPGGGLDPGETPEDAALREAYEEVGLPLGHATTVGALSTLWVIVSKFVVHPIVAIASEPPTFRPSPWEVDALVEVPLATLRDPASVRWGRRMRQDLLIRCPYFEVPGPPVWGATAMMLGEFCTVLDPAFRPPPIPADDELDRLLEIV
jgi:8-oxo-dGTP pyrophosphatase MutT (NUDIX family)